MAFLRTLKDRGRTIWIAFGSRPEDHLTHGVEQAKGDTDVAQR